MIRVLTATAYLEAPTAEEAVGLLLESARLGPTGETAGEYMRAVSERVRMWNGATVRNDNALAFLEDLERAGLILIEADEGK